MTVITLALLIGFVVWLIGRNQPRRDAAAAQEWVRLKQYAQEYQLDLLCIENDYVHWHNGSKAVVSVYADPGRKRDAWFWWAQVRAGSVVAVRFTQGWGPHTQRDDVLYIGDGPTHRSGIYATLDAKTLTRTRRHHERINTPAFAGCPSNRA